MARVDPAHQREELQSQRRKVDFDTYDITVDELVRRVSRGRIEISPAYQRQFRWGPERQSRLVESILLGIPVPPLFMATNVEENEGQTWEVVDGLQRLLSLTNFLGDNKTRKTARLEGESLRLRDLEILPSINGLTADELPADMREGLLDRPVKVIVLNDKSDVQVRFDLFERLNTGGIRLTDQEVREAVFSGDFIDLLTELAETKLFDKTVNLQTGKHKDGTPQDFVLRFFAFYERYKDFDHSVKDFLNEFCASAADEPKLDERRMLFTDTFSFLSRVFPSGIHRGKRSITPVNVYEGVAVGAALALSVEPNLPTDQDLAWIDSEEFRELTTGATNDRKRVVGRIEFSRDRFLAGE
ncbi:DUF262 domain-containing protein [Nesterenkonia ebinurensis]|uniref:DUF262 domain-containing protein n=1 Tax=Nesterenkonia ebinurensis TaxID=2608252 RepID=UPI001CC5EFFE|nr:DUF262 domain-containing protein [Nesterenkonia ebinurensis]